MSFAKLDSGIIRSSIWAEPLATRVLWITMLALKDENGFVSCARSGLQRCANISVEEFDTAIKALESPDLDSRTPDYDGCRVAKIDGGWIILNHEKYRLHDDIHREKTRERVRKFRENHDVKKNVTQCNVTDTLPSVSVSVSSSLSEKEDKSAERRREKQKLEEQAIMIYGFYPKKKDKGHALIAIKTALVKCDFDTLLEAVKKYALSVVGKDPQFIPYPATWFNGLRWEDQEPEKTEKQLRDEALAKELEEWGKKVAK